MAGPADLPPAMPPPPPRPDPDAKQLRLHAEALHVKDLVPASVIQESRTPFPCTVVIPMISATKAGSFRLIWLLFARGLSTNSTRSLMVSRFAVQHHSHSKRSRLYVSQSVTAGERWGVGHTAPRIWQTLPHSRPPPPPPPPPSPPLSSTPASFLSPIRPARRSWPATAAPPCPSRPSSCSSLVSFGGGAQRHHPKRGQRKEVPRPTMPGGSSAW